MEIFDVMQNAFPGDIFLNDRISFPTLGKLTEFYARLIRHYPARKIFKSHAKFTQKSCKTHAKVTHLNQF